MKIKDDSRENSRDIRHSREHSFDSGKENRNNTSVVLQRVVDLHKNRKIAQAPKPFQDITQKMQNFKNSHDLNNSLRNLKKDVLNSS